MINLATVNVDQRRRRAVGKATGSMLPEKILARISQVNPCKKVKI